MGRFAPPGLFGAFLRVTGYRLRPPRPAPFASAIHHRQDALLARGAAGPHERAALLHEAWSGPVPAVVLGGFVPDATEAVYLFRRALLRFGSLYCFNYPRRGFSNELLFAQLDDLVDELSLLHGRPPVILAISFGAGLVIPWLKGARRGASRPDLRGLVLISPVACVENLLPSVDNQPRTLMGRALKPYLKPGAVVETKLIEKSRTVFQKMFEAGAQNQEALRTILLCDEFEPLRPLQFSGREPENCPP